MDDITSLAFSLWIVGAGLGGIVSGLLHVAMRVGRKEGGGPTTILRALQNRKRHLAALATIDFIGGVFVAGTAYGSGVTEPSTLVEFTNAQPWLGWALIGGLGPVFAGRVFTGGFVRGRYDGWVPVDDGDRANGDIQARSDIADEAWRLRIEIVETLEDAIWSLVSATLESGAAKKRILAKSNLLTDARCRYLINHVERYFSQRRRRRMPDPITEQLKFARLEPQKGTTFRDRCVALADACIDEGHWDIIEALINTE